VESFYKGKKILVTGGSGSIGSEIVKKLVLLPVDSIRVFDNNETALFDLETDLNSSKIRTLIGDVRDLDRLNRAFEDIDIIFHAAALKHVPLCEFNPFDAVKTNVIGTQNVLDGAINCNVTKVILVSTDKAVNPINVMGATKLLAERLMLSANSYAGDKGTIFSCVRFGNVLNSRGSVIPLFKKQIKNGGPLTITDSNMTRFIMHISDATDLILKSGQIAEGGEIFILKMPAVKIVDLANVMIDTLAPIHNFNPEDIDIEFIGKRIGEKLYEELMTEEELIFAHEEEELFILNNILNNNKDNNFIYNSNFVEHLSKDKIKRIVEEMINF
jgi:FlaA1/EpsC-like NDP-sugar epimerase